MLASGRVDRGCLCALIGHPGGTAEDTASRRPDGASEARGDQAWASRGARGGRSGRGLLDVLPMFPRQLPSALSRSRCTAGV